MRPQRFDVLILGAGAAGLMAAIEAGRRGRRVAVLEPGALSAQTMECRNVPGLYFIGEVVDVTGHLGGFNFQWAWASGAAAGRAV